MTYRTPVGSARFGRVALVPGTRTAYIIDADGHGFVLVAAIPRAAIPGDSSLIGWRTAGNFDANLGGVDRFWWSNADGSASRETFDEPTEARLYPGSWAPIRFLTINALPVQSWMGIGPFGFAGLPKLPVLNGRDEIIQTLQRTVYPPELSRDWGASYEGGLTRTRGAERRVGWKRIEISGERVEFAQALGWSGNFNGENDEGVCFLVTHLFTPQAAQVTLDLAKPVGDHEVSGKLNGVALPEVSENGETGIDVMKPLALQAGWNELVIRYTYIWGENNFGASVRADPAVLWKLRISGQGID